jgi:hypothetical protein
MRGPSAKNGKWMNQLCGYIDELKHMPEFAHITNWKGILDVY